ncbi:ATP/GTP-binding protein [Streptomyces tsukubensis]
MPAPPEPPAAAAEGAVAAPVAKFVVTGGFGVGKTTLIGAVSEITPLRSETTMTQASTRTDHLTGVEGKTTTTTAMDFGRVTFTGPHPLKIYLFGTPGQERFHHVWKELAHGAVGTVVLVDTARLGDGFAPLDFAEELGIPFVIAVNEFTTAARRYPDGAVREALDLGPAVPLVRCDARNARSAATVLATLVAHALNPTNPAQPAGVPL